MAAGKVGFAIALQILVFLINFTGQSSRSEVLDDFHQLELCEKYLIGNCVKHFGVGHGILYQHLLSPSGSRGRSGSNGKQRTLSTHKVKTLNLLLTFSLLLSGDIHPCPGPVNDVKKRTPKYPCTSCQKGVTTGAKLSVVPFVRIGHT